MVVAGVDIGSRRARIVTIDPAVRHPGRFEVYAYEGVGEPVDIAADAAAWATDTWWYVQPDVIWVEQPFGRNQRAQFQLGMMAGAVLSGVEYAASIDLVSPGEWRKLIGLKGNATKAEVVAWAREETGRELDEHAADAYGIARAILAHGARGSVGDGAESARSRS